MVTDIRLSVTFMQHPKVVKLRRRIGGDAVLSLIQLWAFTAQYRSDGVLSGMDDEDIEIAAGWMGDTGVLVRDLLDVGLLDIADGVYEVHDWQENNPYAAGSERRSEKARKAAYARHGIKDAPVEDKHCSSNQDVMLNDACSTATSTIELCPVSVSVSVSESVTKEEGETACEVLTLVEFSRCYQDTFGCMMPGGINQEARELCKCYPRQKLIEAFAITAENRGQSLRYLKEVLKGKPRAPTAAAQPSKGELLVERNKAAAAEAMRLVQETKYGRGMGGSADSGAAGVVINVGS